MIVDTTKRFKVTEVWGYRINVYFVMMPACVERDVCFILLSVVFSHEQKKRMEKKVVKERNKKI